eukprot:symbB.v1.2.008865.t1/scaffold558.1/size187683/6
MCLLISLDVWITFFIEESPCVCCARELWRNCLVTLCCHPRWWFRTSCLVSTLDMIQFDVLRGLGWSRIEAQVPELAELHLEPSLLPAILGFFTYTVGKVLAGILK